MTLKKTHYSDDEIAIYDDAVIHKRGKYWQMHKWLHKEKKYARFSLRTRNRDTAIDKANKLPIDTPVVRRYGLRVGAKLGLGHCREHIHWRYVFSALFSKLFGKS